MSFKKIHNIYSPIAIKHNINNFPGVDYETGHCPGDISYSSDNIWSNILLLHQNCITPIINAFGSDDIRLTSVYRSYELNKALGGGFHSQHTKGYAADIVSTKHPSSTLWNWCFNNLPAWHQLIWEFPERGIYSPNNIAFSWVHISFIEGNNPRTTSLSSKMDQLHEEYVNEKNVRIGNYTHGIVIADENLIS